MIRVLITSNKHPEYDKTGVIVKDLGEQGVAISLDLDGRVVHVPEKQWKMTSMQDPIPDLG